MPISQGQDSGANMAGMYSVADNPVFKVSVKSLATDSEQPAGSGEPANFDRQEYKLGDLIKGQSFENEELHTGYITQIDNENKLFIKIKDTKTNSTIKLDYSTCTKENPQADGAKNSQQLQFTVERKILSYDEFLNENKKRNL